MELPSDLMEDRLHDKEDIGKSHMKDKDSIFIREETLWMRLRRDCHRIGKSSTEDKDNKGELIWRGFKTYSIDFEDSTYHYCSNFGLVLIDVIFIYIPYLFSASEFSGKYNPKSYTTGVACNLVSNTTNSLPVLFQIVIFGTPFNPWAVSEIALRDKIKYHTCFFASHCSLFNTFPSGMRSSKAHI